MIRRLSSGEQYLTELASPLRMSFPAASKHVRVLQRARLVRRRIVGRTHICRLNAAPIRQIAQWTEGYRKFWEKRFEALDDLLVEMQELATQTDNKHDRSK